MKFVLGEVAEVIVNVLSGDFESFVQSFAFGELREGASTSNGASAAISFPFDIGDLVVFDFEEHFHLVTTNGVADNAFSVVSEF